LFLCFCGGLSLRVNDEGLAKKVVCPMCTTKLTPREGQVLVNRTPDQIPREYFLTNGKMPF